MDTLGIISLALIFLGSLGGILLVVVQARGSSEDKADIISSVKSENSILKESVKQLSSESALLKTDLKIRDEKIQDQNLKIQALSNRVIEKSEYIEKYVSGGSSFPNIQIAVSKGQDKSHIEFHLFNSFDFPVYNILAQVYDYDQLQLKSVILGQDIERTISYNDYFACQIIDYSRDLLAPQNQQLSIGTCDAKTCTYYIKIFTRNMVLRQNLAILIVDNRIYTAYELYDGINNKLLKQDYPTQYPEHIVNKLREMVQEVPVQLKLNLSR